MMTWDDDAGDWQNLAISSQVPRYTMLARIIQKFCPGGAVLDVGCGEAVILDYLSQGTVYLGIEPSKKASGFARTKYGPKSIVNVTAEEFDGVQQWDCILFNEVLYYTPMPSDLMTKYARLLRPGGIIVISIFQRADQGFKQRLLSLARPRKVTNNRCTKIVRSFMIREGWSIEVDETVEKPGTRDRWRIFAARPKS